MANDGRSGFEQRRVTAAVSLLGALDLWWSGEEVPSSSRMGPWTVLTWGRIGKAVTFVAGATVVLDLIGERRLREIGENRRLLSRIRRALAIPMFVLLGLLSVAFLVGLFGEWLSRIDAYGYVEAVRMGTRFGTFTTVSLVAWLSTLGVLLTSYLASRTAEGFMAILRAERPALALRYVAVVLLVVGFLLDMLAS